MIKLCLLPSVASQFPLFQLAIVVAAILSCRPPTKSRCWGNSSTASISSSYERHLHIGNHHREILYQSMAHIGVHDRLCLPRLVAHPVPHAYSESRIVVDLIGRNNLFWLRSAIARERGIAAYRAWLPFEQIRPATVRSRSGSDNSHGPPTTSHPTHRSRVGWFGESCSMSSFFCLSPFCCRSLPVSRY